MLALLAFLIDSFQQRNVQVEGTKVNDCDYIDRYNIAISHQLRQLITQVLSFSTYVVMQQMQVKAILKAIPKAIPCVPLQLNHQTTGPRLPP